MRAVAKVEERLLILLDPSDLLAEYGHELAA